MNFCTGFFILAVFDANTNDSEFMVNQDSNSYDPNDAGPIEYETIYYWRIDDVNEDTGKVTIGTVWDLTTEREPTLAMNPSPSDGAVNRSINAVMHWAPGVDANSHDVYFGTSFASVRDATTSDSDFMGNQYTISNITQKDIKRILKANFT